MLKEGVPNLKVKIIIDGNPFLYTSDWFRGGHMTKFWSMGLAGSLGLLEEILSSW